MSLSGRRTAPISALVAVAMWLFGFEVLPLAHVMFHDTLGEHAHGGHAHDGNDHEEAHHHAHHEDDRPRPAKPEPKHGEGSVAHHDLAAQPAQLALPPVPEARICVDPIAVVA
ncbi:MAG: hypothetical protein WBG86_07390, partial [Polyangiales bacterium]